MSTYKTEDDANKDSKNCTNNFTNNTILNNSSKPTNVTTQNTSNAMPNMPIKPNFPFQYVINPLMLNNPNFKQFYPQLFQNVNMPNNNGNNTTNSNGVINPAANTMKMPVMGIPVIFPSFMFGSQDQTPVGERCKIWIGKIPEGISETFMKKLLDSCGQVTSWRRVTNSSGKLNSFGFCEYSTVESILKCLRLLNGYPLLGSELQVKIGSETEEFLKKWRERKKIEWINSMTMQGIPVNIEEIKKKEENGEPLEWELKLVSNDQEVLKTINEIVSQRQQIDNISKQNDNDIFLKDLTDLANSNILENIREKERKRKKLEKIKKFEKLFYDFEKNWLKHENNREKEKIKIQKEEENWPKKRQKLIEKDLAYDSDKEKKYNEGLKGIGNKGYKISTSFINKKKNEERLRIREKEREYDNALRDKENQMLFKNIDNKDTYLLLNDNLDTLINKNMKEILAIAPEEKKPQTTFEIQDYNSNSNPNLNEAINNTNTTKEQNPKEEIKINAIPKERKEKENIKDKDKDNNTDNNRDRDIIKDNIKDKNIKENNIKKNEEENKKENKIKEENKVENDEYNMEEEKNEIKIENMNLEQLMAGIPGLEYIDIHKAINSMIPDKVDDLFKYKIDWDLIAKYELKRKRIKVFIQKKLLDYFDEVDSFTKFILEKLGVLTPYELQEKVKYVLEENTEVSIYYLFYNHLINLFL